jgi:hypothetical protein
LRDVSVNALEVSPCDLQPTNLHLANS